MRRTIDLTINAKVNESGKWVHNVGRNNYKAYGYVDVDIFLGDVKVNMDIPSLMKVLANENEVESFRKQSCECVSKLKENFLSKCEDKILERDTEFYDYLVDVSITYDDDSCFCIVVCTRDALEHLEEHWNAFLDKEWEKYESKEEEAERC